MFRARKRQGCVTILRKFLCTVILLFVFALTVVGQEISERLCYDIDVSVMQPLKPTNVNRRETYTDECVFEFTLVNSDTAYVSVEKHKTKKESHKSLRSSLSAFTAFDDFENPPKSRSVKINADGYWDEAFFHISHYPENFMLLRKGKFEITLISSNHKILVELEERLRGIKFEN